MPTRIYKFADGLDGDWLIRQVEGRALDIEGGWPTNEALIVFGAKRYQLKSLQCGRDSQGNRTASAQGQEGAVHLSVT